MILQFKVQIKYTKPAVWRRLQVDSQMTFYEFHNVLQAAFDWEDDHLHGYRMMKVEGKTVSDVVIGINEEEDFGLINLGQFDEKEERLCDWFLMEKDRCMYTYDFGDDWEHDILLEKIVHPEENVLYPLCLKAMQLAPEENSRGMEDSREHVLPKKLTSQVNEELKPLTRLITSSPLESDMRKRLIIEMKELHAASPWEWLFDDQVFIVEDSISNEKLFISVLGGSGQEFGLAVYIGYDGYLSVRNTMENSLSMDELVLSQRSILASFVDREELEADDYEFLNQLGMKFRGKKQWPQFRSFKPGDYPWSIDEEEVRLLLLAIEQTLIVLSKAKAGLIAPNFLEDGEFFARVLLEDDTWEDRFLTVREIEQIKAVKTEPKLYISEIDLMRMKKLPTSNMKIQFDVFHMMFPVQPKPQDRPYFPLMAVAMDAQKGSAIHQKMYEGKNRAEIVQLGFIDMMSELGNIPREVWMKEDTFVLLQPVIKHIKIKVIRVEKLNYVEELKAFLAEMNR